MNWIEMSPTHWICRICCLKSSYPAGGQVSPIYHLMVVLQFTRSVIQILYTIIDVSFVLLACPNLSFTIPIFQLANIVCARNGVQTLCKLTDFGLSRYIRKYTTDMTMCGMLGELNWTFEWTGLRDAGIPGPRTVRWSSSLRVLHVWDLGVAFYRLSLPTHPFFSPTMYLFISWMLEDKFPFLTLFPK